MDLVWLKFFLLKLFASFVVVRECYSAQIVLRDQKYFKKVASHGEALPQEDILSSYAVHFQLECSFKCLLEESCVAYNYRHTSERDSENCQLVSNKTQKGEIRGNGDWNFYQDYVESLTEKDMKSDKSDVKYDIFDLKTHLCTASSSLQIRLSGTKNNYSGRVEICHPTFGWGTVCDDTWDVKDGNVTCRQLGFTGASAIRIRAYYGKGSGPILLDGVFCTGDEHHLWDCYHKGWNKHFCGHHEDAGVECY